ncbi:hypothetical protein LCGC14_2729700, partial [marine sediment metagenome]
NIEKIIKKGNVKGLLKALKYEKSYYVRGEAAKALGNIGGLKVVEPLITSLNDIDGINYNAIVALGRKGDSRAVEPLIALLDHSNDSVRSEAAKSLGRIGDLRALEPLLAALERMVKDYQRCFESKDYRKKDYDGEYIFQTIYSLDKIMYTQAVEPLIKYLKYFRFIKNESKICQIIAEFLGEIGDPKAVEPLLASLYHPSENTRKAIIRALKNLGRAPSQFEILVASTIDFDRNFRIEAIKSLGQMKDSRAVEPLLASLNDPFKEVHNTVITVLKTFGITLSQLEILIASLHDANKNIRLEVIKSLGQEGDPRAVESIIPFLADNDKNFRIEAIKSLGQMKDSRAVEPLLASLKDPSEDVCREGIYALGKIRDPRAVEPLITLLPNFMDEIINFSYNNKSAPR